MELERRYTGGVAYHLRRISLACLVVGGLACAEVDDLVDSGSPVGKDAAVAGRDTVDFGLPGCGVTKTVELDPRQADVLLLLDRSGSMETAFGPGTRYQAVAGLFGGLVQTYGDHVRFGFQEMPGRQSCTAQLGGGCCASPPLVGISETSGPAVTAAIAAAGPMDGNTPTAASLQAALDYYKSLGDGVDNRYVLLATDGVPNCTLVGTLSGSDASDAQGAACTDALAQVDAMVALGVRVVVLGVGPGLADDAGRSSACLDALAHAGGAAASPGSPGYYTAGDPQQLQMVIEQIFGGITRPSCSVRFKTPVPDTSTVSVYLDGKEIPRYTANGWSLDTSLDPPSVLISGTYCAQIQDFQVSAIDARFECQLPSM